MPVPSLCGVSVQFVSLYLLGGVKTSCLPLRSPVSFTYTSCVCLTSVTHHQCHGHSVCMHVHAMLRMSALHICHARSQSICQVSPGCAKGSQYHTPARQGSLYLSVCVSPGCTAVSSPRIHPIEYLNVFPGGATTIHPSAGTHHSLISSAQEIWGKGQHVMRYREPKLECCKL